MDPMTSMIIADLVTTTTAVAETSEAPVVDMRIHSIVDSLRGLRDHTATGKSIIFFLEFWKLKIVIWRKCDK